MVDLRVAAVAFDASRPLVIAGWWQRLLGGTVEEQDDGDATLHAPGLDLDFFAVPEAKSGKNRLHLDLRGPAYEEAVEHALSLGATLADDVYDGGSWQVLRDPEGNEFCILRPRSTSENV